MSIRIIIAIVLSGFLNACTSIGAPPPGERAAMAVCNIGERKVCTGVTGSRLKVDDNVSCTCRLIDDVQQF